MSISYPDRRQFLASAIAGSSSLFLSQSGCSRQPAGEALPGDLTQLTLLEASAAIRERRLSPVALTRACIDRIEKIDPQLNSFITVTRELAVEAAERSAREIATGDFRGALHGIPIAIKDNIDTAGVRTTAGSMVFKDRVPEKDADVVRRLKEAGAVILGKLNMHELAEGATSAHSHFGAVHNPWDIERISGGSSGGSGAAVAANLCFGALGSDTGGSIRIPAGYCGVVGLNPTFGMVSIDGIVPLSRSYDRIGPLARTVSDAALLFQALTDHPSAREFDPFHPASVSKLKVGILPMTEDFCDTPPDKDVGPVFAAALEVVRSIVAEMGEASLPVPELGWLVDYEFYRIHEKRIAESPELYPSQLRDSILTGKRISDVEAKKLSTELLRHRESIGDAFGKFDLMVLPTNQTDPMKIKDAKDPFAGSACTFAFSIAGIPSISIPCGFSKNGFPAGLQIAGPPRSEPQILALAHAYEKRTAWHKRHPKL